MNPSKCICENGKYLGSFNDNLVIMSDEIINAAGNVSKNVTSALSKNFYYKKVRYKIDCYILHTVLLVIILLFIIAITCYHYAN